MAAETPAHLSYEIMRRIAVVARTEATRETGTVAKHLASGHVLEFSKNTISDVPAATVLADSPAELSQALLRALFGMARD